MATDSGTPRLHKSRNAVLAKELVESCSKAVITNSKTGMRRVAGILSTYVEIIPSRVVERPRRG